MQLNIVASLYITLQVCTLYCNTESIYGWGCQCHSRHTNIPPPRITKPVQSSAYSSFHVSHLPCCSSPHLCTNSTHTQIYPLLFAEQDVRGQADVTVRLMVVCLTDSPLPAGKGISVNEEKKIQSNIYQDKNAASWYQHQHVSQTTIWPVFSTNSMLEVIVRSI